MTCENKNVLPDMSVEDSPVQVGTLESEGIESGTQFKVPLESALF